MTVTLVLPDHIAAELFDATSADVETACVLLARHVETPGGNVRLLARVLHWVPDTAYRRREATALSIASHGYVPALAAAEADGAVPIWLHTHPGNDSSPRPSKCDELVDEQLADLFRLRAGSDLYGAVVIAQPEGRRCFTGHIESENRRIEIDRLWVTGRRFMLIQHWLHDTMPPSEQFDRTSGPSAATSNRSSATYASPSSAAVALGRQSSSNSFVLACATSNYSTRIR